MSELSGAVVLKPTCDLSTSHLWLICGDSTHPGYSTKLMPSDHFEIHGPNGKHSCFVMPVMGPSICVATKRGLLLLMAKSAVLDLANGIGYMTSRGVVLYMEVSHALNLKIIFCD